MKTRIINTYHVALNEYTQYGRTRNKVIWNMLDNGCQIIKEYRESRNSRVYLGYKNPYVNTAEFAARVCRNGKIEEKHSKAMRSPLPSSVQTFFVEKTKTDENGHKEQTSKTIKIRDGALIYMDISRQNQQE